MHSRETGFNNDDKNPDPVSAQVETPKAAAPHPSVEDCKLQIQELSTQLQGFNTQLKDKDAKYVYLYAEFENFKKRTQKERSDLIKFGWESVARDLLETADNLDLAISHTPAGTDNTLINGLKLVLTQFKSAMQKQGVQAVESLNKNFDPHLHEAVAQEESNVPSGMITKELSCGYTLHGRLLRPARVIVSAGPKQEENIQNEAG